MENSERVSRNRRQLFAALGGAAAVSAVAVEHAEAQTFESNPVVADVATAKVTSFSESLKGIETRYFSLSTLKGGAHYRRISFADLGDYKPRSYFRSEDRFMPDGSSDAANGGYWVIDEPILDLHMLGGIGNDFADDTEAIKAWSDLMGRRGGDFVVPKGIFRSTTVIQFPSNVTIRFVGWIKQTAHPGDGFDCVLINLPGAHDVIILNPQIDCGNVPSVSGIILRTGAHNTSVLGGTIKNCAHDKVGPKFGGRGFILESSSNALHKSRNVTIFGVKVVDSYMGFAVRGGDPDEAKHNVVISGITIENCDVAFWLVAFPDSYPVDADGHQGVISNVSAYNCGRNSQYNNSDGAFVSERGCNFRLSNITLHNDTAYGSIRSVWHGNGARIVGDIVFHSGTADYLFDLGPYREADNAPATAHSFPQNDLTITAYGTVSDIIRPVVGIGAPDGYADNSRLAGRAGTVTSGKAVSIGYTSQSKLFLDFYENTNAARLCGLASAIGGTLFSVASDGILPLFSGADFRGFAPAIQFHDLSVGVKDFQIKVDSGQITIATEAVADSGLYDRPVLSYSDTTGIGRAFSQGTEVFAWTPSGPRFSPPASVTPPNNGNVMFELTNNTTLTFKVKGLDGVVRSGTVTLS